MDYPDNPHVHWRRISLKLAFRAVLGSVVSLAVAMIVTVALTFVDHPFPWWVLGLVLVIAAVVDIPLAFARVRSIGYALRQDDILYKRGVITRSLRAVPYGRLQAVDVHRGPLDRMLGIATLSTATAAGPGVKIPGLTVSEADQLRDHLIRVAETRRAGL